MRVEGGSVEGVKKRVHDRVGDGGYKVPPKWGLGEAEVDRSEAGREDSKDEGVDMGGREQEGPVEVWDISSMKEDEVAGAKGRLDVLEVGERVVGRKEGVSGVGKLAIKNCTKLEGVELRFDEEVSCGR
jgi:hypothetical protein